MDFYIYQVILDIFFKYILLPLSGLSWKTEMWRTKKLCTSGFIICSKLHSIAQVWLISNENREGSFINNVTQIKLFDALPPLSYAKLYVLV